MEYMNLLSLFCLGIGECLHFASFTKMQVNKIDIHYDKTSKQVDVQVLKETLWDQIQGLNQTSVQVNP